ncbi:glycosyltransferase family 15 protein [[Candida] arabinofermentans NRRL YB-2248]|uniref:Glycosyltransferase family 15 protein n=1 Tax=[Candida] arabinofermentans NRRL YB-2248 TaxID=983967 RepID=A0A1E4SUA7_9ASCO|nr:glycosyltransferase family 15 protein [[Candida] arabinofermentans NRRL YB-2248]
MTSELPKESAQDISTRRKIILSIILISTLIGFPLWCLTTTVHRAELPESKIYQLNEQLISSIHYEIPVYLDLPEPLKPMIYETQRLINDELKLKNLPIDWKIILKNEVGSDKDYKIILELNEETESMYISPFDDKIIKLMLSSNVITTNKVPDFITKVLIDHVFNSEIKMFQELNEPESVLKIPYSPNYHVTLSLLQGGLTPISWEIEKVDSLFMNYLKNLENYAKFSLDSQVEHYEPLSDKINLRFDNETGISYLKESDTSTFIDYSEWGLDQNTNLIPVINFIVYIPSIENSPILIENSESNSFIVPQWGGVTILNTSENKLTENDLIPVLEVMASQLFQLIGAPTEPKSPFIRSDILVRYQTLKNLQKSIENLLSLVKLAKQLPTISIPDSALTQVEISIDKIEEAIQSVNQGLYGLGSKLSGEAFVLSNKAFFQKDMHRKALLINTRKIFAFHHEQSPRTTLPHTTLPRSVQISLQSENHTGENATILSLCRNQDLYEIMRSVRRLEDRFNHKFHYDWVFLNNEPFSDEFKTKVGNLVSGEAKFGLIDKEHWSYPDFIDQDKAREERKKMSEKGIIYADLESYRHMCRFNSGFFYKHELMKPYKYYWRVEPDVKFYCDIDKDPFKYLRETGKTYGFTISIHEFHATIETLWDEVSNFLSLNKDAQHENSFIDFISDDKGKTYNLCHFWSNFEIADMDFWRSDIYESFFNYLDSKGGFFYERWGDAPIHSIAVALFLDKEKIHYFEDIGYNHGVYSMCPIDDDIWLSNKCNCNMNDDFTFRGYSCGQKYFEVTKKTKPPNWKQYADL